LIRFLPSLLADSSFIRFSPVLLIGSSLSVPPSSGSHRFSLSGPPYRFLLHLVLTGSPYRVLLTGSSLPVPTSSGSPYRFLLACSSFIWFSPVLYIVLSLSHLEGQKCNFHVVSKLHYDNVLDQLRMCCVSLRIASMSHVALLPLKFGNVDVVRPRSDANCPSLSISKAFVNILATWRCVLVCWRLISPTYMRSWMKW
jgi:hypothetical protein